MALPNTRHRAATSTPKKAITGISPLQLHVRKRAQKLFTVWFSRLLLSIKVVDDEGPTSLDFDRERPCVRKLKYHSLDVNHDTDFQIVTLKSTGLLRFIYFHLDHTGYQLVLFTQPFRNEWYARIYLYLVGDWHLSYTGGAVAGTKNLFDSTCFESSYLLPRYCPMNSWWLRITEDSTDTRKGSVTAPPILYTRTDQYINTTTTGLGVD